MSQFSKSWGQWLGSAEVFDGSGRFVGNGMDVRNVQKLDDSRTRIDVTFAGPFKASGHYIIETRGNERFYQGPVNIGHADVVSESVVDANAYWADLGLTQRFCLFVLPDGNTQLSLAQMSRGDQLIYTVVGENYRIDKQTGWKAITTPGTAYDLHDDPHAGRPEALWSRAGTWQGEIFFSTDSEALRSALPDPAGKAYTETIQPAGNQLMWSFNPTLLKETQRLVLSTNRWQAWSERGAMVGSLSQCGGRATSGYFYHESGLRVWRREVIRMDGTQKAIMHLWYQGSQCIAREYAMLDFTPYS